MNEEIIARFKRRDGFVKEMVVPDIKSYFEFADIPPLKVYGYENIEEVQSEIKGIIKRQFKLISKKIVVEYEEI